MKTSHSSRTSWGELYRHTWKFQDILGDIKTALIKKAQMHLCALNIAYFSYLDFIYIYPRM